MSAFQVNSAQRYSYSAGAGCLGSNERGASGSSKEVKPGGTIIYNANAFTPKNLKLAGAKPTHLKIKLLMITLLFILLKWERW